MEDESAVRNLLCAVFGDSEDDSGEDGIFSERQWEHVEEVEGLWICRDFLSNHEQQELIDDIEAVESWFTNPNENQAMRFGGLPLWALNLSALVHSCVLEEQLSKRSKILAREVISREPLFDQMIVNSYKPLEGIGAHVDLLRFEDGIVILSLVSSRVMTFKSCEDGSRKVGVMLRPGDLLVMSGEARYGWTHEINTNPAQQIWDGVPVPQESRISVTLRRLCRQN
ncbi:hypothetical protein SELMODRAFT_165238 [Selaginella moellendorffii]|uniref:Fe2OG dioxygenase domain-containing protein n=1 Tax=Selaginella moellendorffii TaxID=88036 RepID=D8QT65_SELML|nr:alkylated DNA repair protein alkB homolog 8 isoform X1 [Selaginella moellendorffii]EFJ37557.1 hypothetical protein SELMODRAFT_165238 [Selaginella moellendorffii]|eukprot:XP_002962297.1 alkylated DNA repair protein alkB homolog 8 isoform X1 [Selaginella moellendorffii]